MRTRQTRGFSLIEVLVAMIILGIGLLGLAALQARSLKFNHDAHLRTQGTILAYDIMETMRLVGKGCAPSYDTSGATVTVPTGATCAVTGSDITADVARWRAALAARLPEPAPEGGTAADAGDITQNTVTPEQFTIDIKWYDREQDRNLTQSWELILE